LGRLTPYKYSPDNASHKILGYLPAELAFRAKDKGMEGLTLTPDGTTLVGVMQSALQQPDLGGTKPGNVAPTRIVAINLRTFETKQYLYLLDNPASTDAAVSERSRRCPTPGSFSTSGTATSSRSRRRTSRWWTSTARPTSAV
jgi:hypothetical protein